MGDAKKAEANFNKVFADLDKLSKKGGGGLGRRPPRRASSLRPVRFRAKSGRTPLEKALLADANSAIWVQKYGQERLTYLKDLSKTFYRITQVGAQYTGGKYAALLDNRGPDKLE